MAGTGVSSGLVADRAPAPAPFADAKLRPPAFRAGTVERSAALAHLRAAADAPVVSVVAPAGYGKSTVIGQWVGGSDRKVAWLTLADEDNDPAILLQYLGAALRQVGGSERRVEHTRAGPGGSVAAIVARRVAATLSSIAEPVTLVLDDDGVLWNPQCRDAIGELALHLPPHAQLVVASRSATTLPLPALRARGAVAEIGVGVLAMDSAEAAALLTGAGVQLSTAELDALVAQTEGWPVGLHLAALAYRAGGPTRPNAFVFVGDDRFMADYLRTEVLDRLPAGRRRFLLRTSVLDRLSAGLCDVVLDTTGSAGVLRALDESNLLLLPLDRTRGWYRYHPLFRQLLRAELERRDPGLVPQLHARAARWCEQHELPHAAIAYAREAGDPDEVARLVGANVLRAYAEGHLSTLADWLDWFDERELTARYPHVAVLGAAASALMGQPARAERRAALADRAEGGSLCPDGSSIESWQAVVRAMLCRRGVGEMRRDASTAYDEMAPTSRWRATARLIEGVGWLLDGDLDRAADTLDDAVAVAADLRALPAGTAALAERAVVDLERRDWTRARVAAERALALVRDAHLEDHAPSALAYAVGARTAVHDGDMDVARTCLAHAARLRPQLTHAMPFYSVQTLLELARTYLVLADAAGARTVLRDAADVMRLRPDLGSLSDQIADVRDALDSFEVNAVGASALTTAELRLVPLLSTHLSFPQIGERLHISRHTVKTQAVSLYRKLGVSSRSEAIACLDELGLIGT